MTASSELPGDPESGMGDRDLEGFLADLDGGSGRRHLLTPSPVIACELVVVVFLLRNTVSRILTPIPGH